MTYNMNMTIKCTITDCTGEHVAKGYCMKHYQRLKKYGDPNMLHASMHGMSRSPENMVWRGMKYRCYNKKLKNYRYYGGRGIKVCDRWLESFANFIEDVGLRPGKGYSLDRIDNDGHYEPGNVRWATQTEQRRNARSFGRSGHKGVGWNKNDSLWQAYIGLDGKTIHLGRYKNIEDAIAARQAAEKHYY